MLGGDLTRDRLAPAAGTIPRCVARHRGTRGEGDPKITDGVATRSVPYLQPLVSALGFVPHSLSPCIPMRILFLLVCILLVVGPTLSLLAPLRRPLYPARRAAPVAATAAAAAAIAGLHCPS